MMGSKIGVVDSIQCMEEVLTSLYKRTNKFLVPVSDVFTNFVHEFFLIWPVENRKLIFIVPKQFFFLNMPIEQEIIPNIRQKKS